MKVPKPAATLEPSLALALTLPRDGSTTLAGALHLQLRQAILQGRLAPGTRLPATRTMAAVLGVSRNTVLQAYDLLASEGYTEAHAGGGTSVAARLHLPTPPLQAPAPAARAPRQAVATAAPAVPPTADFSVGRPDLRSFPADVWNRLQARATRALFRATDPAGGPQGLAALREAISSHGSTTRAVAASPGNVVVTHGAQQAFHLIGRWLRAQGMGSIAVENPGYAAARAAFVAAGLRVLPVPVDAEGLVVEAIPRGVRAVCVTPSHQFPLGVCLPLARRLALLQWAQARRALVIEDDYDSEFRYSPRPLDALHALAQGGRVVYVGTFSKSMFPELRVGYAIAPAPMAAELAHIAQAQAGTPPPATQAALAAFIAEGHLWRHTRAMQKRYAERRMALLQALQAHPAALGVPYASLAGLHVATRLPSRGHEARALAAAASLGIIIEGLSQRAFAPGAPAGLSFGLAALDATTGPQAATRLAQALAR